MKGYYPYGSPGDVFNEHIRQLVTQDVDLISQTLELAAIASVLALIVGALGRFVARSRVRAGHADPLEKCRNFVTRRPRWTALFTALPALGWSSLVVRSLADGRTIEASLLAAGQFVLPTGVAFVSIAYLARAMRRAFLAPTFDGESKGEAAIRDAEGFTFDAVAVTTQTAGAVGGMAALSVGMIAMVSSRTRLNELDAAGILVPLLAAYVVAALGGAFLFVRKSKIAIGIDGVLVGGTTRRQFVAYRDIDLARAVGDTIELRARKRTVLRLQLHGEDAGRREAIIDRLNAAIARVQSHRADPAAAFVEGASVAELSRAAEGAASYRMTAPTREKLWEIFESPVLAAEARQVAAEALVSGIDDAERTRFRIAADRVAEPATRVRLQELLEANEIEEPEESPRATRAMDSPAYR